MGTRLPHPESASVPISGDSTSGAATIGTGVKIVGEIYSMEDLYVSGELHGTVEVVDHNLTIGPNATVDASVKAREIVVLGSIQGNVEGTEKIEIRKRARVFGEIRTPRIVVEDGAYLRGSVDVSPSQSIPSPSLRKTP